VSSSHGAAERAGDRLEGPLTPLAPEVKVLSLVAFLVVVALTPPSRPWAYAAQLLVAVGAALLALVPLGVLVRRSVFELPVLAIAIVYVVFGHGTRVDLGPLSLSEAGLRVVLAVLAKATIGIVAVSAVAATTTAVELVRGMRRLRFPVWFCDLVALSARQVEVLREEAARVRLAASVRAGGRRRRDEWRAVVRSLGTLFVRSSERAERLSTAIALRAGTTGAGRGLVVAADPADSATATPVADWLVALAPATLALAALVLGGVVA
jgi:cobalt/nickel transport system permease protein